MGEVYRARDTRLDRTVAVKVLPEHIAKREDLRARFEREARAVASLNHPNICTLYDIGTQDGIGAYMVMECLEGETLAARIEKGAIPLEQAISLATQIADALDRAHRAGVTHRDVKPQNIMLTRDGVKVLDFGLAKSSSSKPAPSEATLTAVLTTEGTVMGTPQYMAPEQFEGREADARSDIWAFGAVLYEMVTGQKAFQGKSYSTLVGAILATDPAPMSVKPFTPSWLERLVRRCLAKDPEDRWQSMRDVVIELQTPPQESAAAASSKPSRWFWAVAALAGASTLALGIALWALSREMQPVDRPLVRLDVDLGADVSLGAPFIGGSSVAISPDGMRLAYTSGSPPKLFTRRLDQPKATELPGTQGAALPFFSPDGQWIGFQTSGKLNKISVEGGAVVPLGDFGGGGASGGEDGNIYMGVRGKGVVRIRDSGGAPETIAPLGNGEAGLFFPQLLPGGKAVLFSAYTALNADASSIEVMTLADHHRKTVSRGGTSPHYLATSNGAGYLVYLNKATLFAIPFDLDKLETRGTALPILDDVASTGTLGTALLSISRTGTLVYRKGGGGTGLLTVAWLDGAGKTQPLLAKPGVYGRPSLSQDGQRLALEVTEGSGRDIWVYDWQRDTMTRLTFDGKAQIPAWSPDGRYIVFASIGAGMSVTRSDGAGKAQPSTESKDLQQPWSFTADGKRMAFIESDSKTVNDLWTVPIESDGAGLRAGKPEVFLQTPADERYPAFSPDGRWLAYMSNESGTYQIYVRAFPDKGGKWQVSNNGGRYPMWSRSDLFFESLDQHIMAAAYTVKGDSFVAGKPRLWSEKPLGGNAGSNKNVDLASDGKRIVALMPATEAKESQESQNHVVFLLNFFDELRRKVPVGN